MALVPLEDLAECHLGDWSQSLSGKSLRLGITEHAVHKIANDELVVSTLRPFNLTVALFEGDKKVGDHEQIPLEAQVLFENGQPVPMLPGQPALYGEHATLTDGEVTFKIRLAVLSSQREWKKFRVRIVATDFASPLCVISEPMRTLTKLWRNPAGGAAPCKDRTEGKRRKAEAPDVFDENAEDGATDDPSAEIQELRQQVHAHGETINALREQHETILAMLRETRAECDRRWSCSSDGDSLPALLSYRSDADSYRSEAD